MRFLLPALLGLCITSAARADTFWLSDPKEKLPEGASHRTLTGVLLAQSDEGYHVRIVGGEVLLPKSAVYRIDKDSLSLDDIVQQEQAAAARAAVAEQERQAQRAARQAEAATAPRAMRAVPAEASFENGGRAEPVDPAAEDRPSMPLQSGHYDPVLHRFVPAPGQLTTTQLRRELAFAWRVTRDPRYRDALRQLR